MKMLTILAILILSTSLHSQTKDIKQVTLIDAEDNQIKPFNNESEYTLILLSSTYCGKCINELATYSKLYPELKEKYKLTIFAINTDAYPTYEGRIKRNIKGTNYSFETYLDSLLSDKKKVESEIVC